MLAKRDILHNLRYLNKKFLASKDDKETQLLAKLAVLELSGWIEEAMDDIVLRCAKRCREEKHIKILKDLVKNNHSFKYENFREMLANVIGLVNFNRLEKTVNQNKKTASFEGTLGSIKHYRDLAAHTHTVATTRTNAPSTTISQFNSVYEGLKEFDRVLRKMRI